MEELSFTDYIEKNVYVVAIAGNITSQSVRLFNQFISPILNQVTKHTKINSLVLDMKAVSLLDSSGIGLICGKYVRMKKSGKKLALCNVHPSVQEILKTSGLGSTFTYYQNVPESLAILGTESNDTAINPTGPTGKSFQDVIEQKLVTRK
ncbi:MAG: STAS domain-containing protein [SAR324 cluster bacterium]|nr:STAS domain-containing protein [SAR324 cluster bacterium]